jgi:hypothetical protein
MIGVPRLVIDPDVPPNLAPVGGKSNDPARFPLTWLSAPVWLPIRSIELIFGQPAF